MRKWYGGVSVISLMTLLFLGYYIIEIPVKENYSANPPKYRINPLEWISSGPSPRNFDGTDPLKHINSVVMPTLSDRGNTSQVISTEAITSVLFAQRNLSKEEQSSLQTWNRLRHLITSSQVQPNAIEAIKEASVAWGNLMTAVEEEKRLSNMSLLSTRGNEKQCPRFVSKTNASKFNDDMYKMRFPCGLTQGSSITLIGIPNGLLGNFRIDLTGEPLPGEPDPTIILHYNVRLHGDKVTEDPVIVQNTWTVVHDWGEERRCPTPDREDDKKVDELYQCNKLVGKDINRTIRANEHGNGSTAISITHDGKTRKYFPFKQNDLFVATLRVGSEGIQMTVDGKHITSFAFRDALEAWLISEVRISGDVNLISMVASGLPTSEDLDHTVDLDDLKAVPLVPQRQLNLFVGIFSTTNNFKHRMAIRRSWMQYPSVRAGHVAVRFFVGLHKNQMVNEELWNDARTYEDVQLMPFVDYYSLISWKTIAICIFGSQVAPAKYIMKTDDDSFVRVDEILNSLSRFHATPGLLYGLINSDSGPDRNPDSKWYISPQEWPEEKYPPWAHGPGYIVSRDIAKAIFKKHRKGQLKIFKLEDVAIGIWIADMKKAGLEVRYEKDDRIIIDGCREGYVIAHYQSPRELLCLWQKIQQEKQGECCST